MKTSLKHYVLHRIYNVSTYGKNWFVCIFHTVERPHLFSNHHRSNLYLNYVRRFLSIVINEIKMVKISEETFFVKAT